MPGSVARGGRSEFVARGGGPRSVAPLHVVTDPGPPPLSYKSRCSTSGYNQALLPWVSAWEDGSRV